MEKYSKIFQGPLPIGARLGKAVLDLANGYSYKAKPFRKAYKSASSVKSRREAYIAAVRNSKPDSRVKPMAKGIKRRRKYGRRVHRRLRKRFASKSRRFKRTLKVKFPSSRRTTKFVRRTRKQRIKSREQRKELFLQPAESIGWYNNGRFAGATRNAYYSAIVTGSLAADYGQSYLNDSKLNFKDDADKGAVYHQYHGYYEFKNNCNTPMRVEIYKFRPRQTLNTAFITNLTTAWAGASTTYNAGTGPTGNNSTGFGPIGLTDQPNWSPFDYPNWTRTYKCLSRTKLVLGVGKSTRCKLRFKWRKFPGSLFDSSAYIFPYQQFLLIRFCKVLSKDQANNVATVQGELIYMGRHRYDFKRVETDDRKIYYDLYPQPTPGDSTMQHPHIASSVPITDI